MINTIYILYGIPLGSSFRTAEYTFCTVECTFYTAECLFRTAEQNFNSLQRYN